MDVKEISKWKLWAILSSLKLGPILWRESWALVGFYVHLYELIQDQGDRRDQVVSLLKSDWTCHVAYESLHTWPGEDLISTSYELICFALIPKRISGFFLELTCPIFPRRDVGTSVRCVRTITFGSYGSQALRSMATGRRLTHQRLATWWIATFREIDSRQYAMAYDTRPHKWSYQPGILVKKNLQEEKNSPPRIWGVIWMRGQFVLSTRVRLVRAGDQFIYWVLGYVPTYSRIVSSV